MEEVCHPCSVQWNRLFDYENVPPIPRDMNYFGLYKKLCDAEKKLLCAICHELTEDTPHMMCEHVEPSLCAHTVHLACMGLASEPAKYFCKYHKGGPPPHLDDRAQTALLLCGKSDVSNNSHTPCLCR